MENSITIKFGNFEIKEGTSWTTWGEINTVVGITEDTIYYVKGESVDVQESSLLYELPNNEDIHDLIFQQEC